MCHKESYKIAISESGLKTLKRIASLRGIIPQGNKTKKQTWLDAILALDCPAENPSENNDYKPPTWMEDFISNNGQGESQQEVVVDFTAESSSESRSESDNASAAAAPEEIKEESRFNNSEKEEPETPSQRWERLRKEIEEDSDKEKSKLFLEWAELLGLKENNEYWEYFKVYFKFKQKKTVVLDVEEWEGWVSANLMNNNLMNEINTQTKFNKWEAAYKQCKKFERKQKEKEKKEAEKRAAREAREKAKAEKARKAEEKRRKEEESKRQDQRVWEEAYRKTEEEYAERRKRERERNERRQTREDFWTHLFITPKELEAFQLLNLSTRCTIADVKKAKLEANKKYHPDLNKDPGAEELLKRINSAVDTVLQYFSKTSYATC